MGEPPGTLAKYCIGKRHEKHASNSKRENTQAPKQVSHSRGKPFLRARQVMPQDGSSLSACHSRLSSVFHSTRIENVLQPWGTVPVPLVVLFRRHRQQTLPALAMDSWTAMPVLKQTIDPTGAQWPFGQGKLSKRNPLNSNLRPFASGETTRLELDLR